MEKTNSTNSPFAAAYLRFLQLAKVIQALPDGMEMDANEKALLQAVVLRWYENQPMTVREAISLTELAISRLPLGSGQVASGIQLAKKQTLSGWMDLDYVNALITAVDVGGQYPQYVHDRLQAGNGTDKHHQRFAEEWRAALLLSALQAKIVGQLDERTWQVVADFCRRKAHASASLELAPLAFNT